MWNNIKEALYDMAEAMTVANGFNFNWVVHFNKNIAHPENVYLMIKTLTEENTDDNNFTGTDQYRNSRQVEFYVHLDNVVGIVNLEEVIEKCETQLELARADVLKKFNSVYNVAGDAGATNIQYKGFAFTDEEDANADIYAPVKLVMLFQIDYIEERNI